MYSGWLLWRLCRPHWIASRGLHRRAAADAAWHPPLAASPGPGLNREAHRLFCPSHDPMVPGGFPISSSVSPSTASNPTPRVPAVPTQHHPPTPPNSAVPRATLALTTAHHRSLLPPPPSLDSPPHSVRERHSAPSTPARLRSGKSLYFDSVQQTEAPASQHTQRPFTHHSHCSPAPKTKRSFQLACSIACTPDLSLLLPYLLSLLQTPPPSPRYTPTFKLTP